MNIVSVTSSKANGTYQAGELINIDVVFDGNVDVVLNYRLLLALSVGGESKGVASYISGTGTNILKFQYQVQDGDVTADLNYGTVNSLWLNNNKVYDSGTTTPASLVLPSPTGSMSLGAQKNIMIGSPGAYQATINAYYSSEALSGSVIASLRSDSNNIVTYQLKNDTGAADSKNALFTVTGSSLVAQQNLQPGTYRVYLEAKDANNQTSTQSIDFTIKADPGVVSLGTNLGIDFTPRGSDTEVRFTVVFSEQIYFATPDAFLLTTTGTATGRITGVYPSSPGSLEYTVFVGDVAGDGNLALSMKSGSPIRSVLSRELAGFAGTTSYTIDKTAPAAPSVPVMTSSYDNGFSRSDGITNVLMPWFSGTTEPLSDIQFYEVNTPNHRRGGGLADANGNYSVPLMLPPGTYQIYAIAADPYQNKSVPSALTTVTIDNVAPVFQGLGHTLVSQQNAVRNSLLLSVSATDSLDVQYFLYGPDIEPRVELRGNEVFARRDLVAGNYNFVVAAQDKAGNFTSKDYTVSVQAPPTVTTISRVSDAPVLVGAAAQSVSYTVIFSQPVTGVAANDFVVTGAGGANGSVASVSGIGSTYVVVVSGLVGDGTLRLDLKSSGTSIQDSLGSGIAAGFFEGATYTLDRTAPLAPSAPSLVAASDSGASSSDGTTASSTPLLTGTAEVNAAVRLYENGGTLLLGSAVADSAGTWRIDSSALTDGTHTLNVQATDAAGNIGALSFGTTITVDTLAPVLTSATASGTSLVLIYADVGRLDATNLPATGAFSVVSGGLANAVTAVSIDAAAGTVSLTLATAVLAGQTTTVSYTDPTVGNDAFAIQDVAGNDAASLVARSVTVSGTVPPSTPAPAPAPAVTPAPAPASGITPAPTPSTPVPAAPAPAMFVAGSAGPDRLQGQSGGDTFFPGGGADTIDGGSGTDTVVLAGDRSQYALVRFSDGSVVLRSLVDSTSVATLQNVERLQFDGNKLALDLGTGESGGKTALALGAVLGLQSLSDKGLVGNLLAFFDAGHSLNDVAALAVTSGLVASRAGGSDNAAFVNFVYRAVTGQTPDKGTAGVFQEWLDKGAMTQSDLLALALQHPANQAQVDLVGIATTGLSF